MSLAMLRKIPKETVASRYKSQAMETGPVCQDGCSGVSGTAWIRLSRLGHILFR